MVFMNVENLIANRNVYRGYISPEAWIATALKRLQADDVGALVVSGDGKTVEGIITERDLARGFARYGSRLFKFTIAEVMTESPITCRLFEAVQSVFEKMIAFEVFYMPILDSKDHYCGTVSLIDITSKAVGKLKFVMESKGQNEVSEVSRINAQSVRN
jgi:CBS domain-containing protein